MRSSWEYPTINSAKLLNASALIIHAEKLLTIASRMQRRGLPYEFW